MTQYKVLWLDDEHSTPHLQQFVLESEMKGFDLCSFTSSEEGMADLEKNLESYDLVLLDGLFFKEKDQEAGSEKSNALGDALKKLHELRRLKQLPYFIFSGKDRFTRGDNDLLDSYELRCYDKNLREDIDQLFSDMSSAIEQSKITHLKTKYPVVFKAVKADYLGEEHFSRILRLINHLESIDEPTGTEDSLTAIRKVLETMFHRLVNFGMMDPNILNNKGAITKASYFLAHTHQDYEFSSEFVPPIISENISRILNITQDGSHSEGTLKLRVDAHLKAAKKPYLYYSCIYALFDVVLWFVDLVDSQPDASSNQTKWKKHEKSDWIEGVITRINEKGWGTFFSGDEQPTIGIPPNIMMYHGFSESQKVQVRTKPSPDGSKQHIDEIQLR